MVGFVRAGCKSCAKPVEEVEMTQIRYILALLHQALKAAATNRGQFLFLSAGMFTQNALFFLVWVVFFSAVKNVRGWTLSEIALYQGVLCLGVGSAFFLAEGTRRLADKIRDGELDIFLVRPRHPLPQLLTHEASAWSLGDIVYGILLMLIIGHPGTLGFLYAIATAICVSVLFLSAVTIFQSLAFFMESGGRLAEDLFIAMICLGSAPQHTQGMIMKLLLFTVLPAGFVAILPVEIIRQHNILLLAALAGSVLIYAALAVLIFHAGLKRYTSATGWKI